MSQKDENFIHQSFPLGMKLGLSVTLTDQQAAEWLTTQLHSKQPELHTPENFMKGMRLEAIGFYDVLNVNRARIELLDHIHRQFRDYRLSPDAYNVWVSDILDTLIRQDFQKTVDATVAVPVPDSVPTLLKLVYRGGIEERSIDLKVWESEQMTLSRALDIISVLSPRCHCMASPNEGVVCFYTNDYTTACEVEAGIRKMLDRVEAAQ